MSSPVYAEDLALVARIINGDEAAADEFARQYSKRFAYLAQRAGVPRQDCDDVAQEAWLAALSQMQRGLFRGDSRLSTWLARIVYGKAVDYHRSRRGLPAQLDGTEEAPATWPHAPVSDVELTTTVREVLAQLPPQYRIILLLNRTAGFTLAEISRKLELSLGQVSNKLYVAEEMFRCHLRGEQPRSKRRALPAVALPTAPSSSGSSAPHRQERRLCLSIPRLSPLSNALRRQWADC